MPATKRRKVLVTTDRRRTVGRAGARVVADDSSDGNDRESDENEDPAEGDDSYSEGNNSDDNIEQTAARDGRDDEDDEDDSQMSDLENQMVAYGILYVLSLEHSRKPIKKADFKKEAIGRFIAKVDTRLYDKVFNNCQAKLRNQFGMELVALPPRYIPEILRENATGSENKRRAEDETENSIEGKISQVSESSADVFVLRNILPTEYKKIIAPVASSQEQTQDGLTAIMVMFVAFSDGVISRQMLNQCYVDCGLDRVRNFDEVLNQMRRERYLDWVVERSNNPDLNTQNTQKVYLMSRSKVEFSAHSLLQRYRQLIKRSVAPDALEHNEIEIAEYGHLKRQLEALFS